LDKPSHVVLEEKQEGILIKKLETDLQNAWKRWLTLIENHCELESTAQRTQKIIGNALTLAGLDRKMKTVSLEQW
jgi:hypothetical protein